MRDTTIYFFFLLLQSSGPPCEYYINEKTGRGQRSLSISIYPDEQLPVNSRDPRLHHFSSALLSNNIVHMLVGIRDGIPRRVLLLIKTVFLAGILKRNS